jgi:hypothetical protein
MEGVNGRYIFLVIVCSLHMQENNAHRDDPVCPLIHVFQLKNCWTDFDEICVIIMPLEVTPECYISVSYIC